MKTWAPPLRPYHLWLALLLVFSLGGALEWTLGRSAKPHGLPVTVHDPGGRKLALVILDSLTPENAAAMPTWQALEARGLSADVEPCLERITYVCVRDALTGRSAFSLFGVFENFGTAVGDPGDNLLRDLRQAGRSVGLVTAGDIRPFEADADTSKTFPDRFRGAELLAAVTSVRTQDFTLYHHIWHDTRAHHTQVGTDAYNESVVELDRVLASFVKLLPDDTDLIVIGDHGHGHDGRHVQGQDIPTRMVVVSPRIRPGSEADRVPIHATRMLAGTISGVMSDRMEWDPAWARWMDEGVASELRELVETGSAPRMQAPPVAPLAVLALVLLLAGRGVGWLPAGLAIGAGALMGLTFEIWLDTMHFPGHRPRVDQVLWWVPATLAGLGLVGGSRWVWRLTFGFALGALLLLHPVLHHYGVLQNIGSIGLAALAGPTVAILLSRPSARRLPMLVLAGGLAYSGWWWMGDVRVFNLEIVQKWGAAWVGDLPWLAHLLNALLAVGIQRLVDRTPTALSLGAAGAGAVLGHLLTPSLAVLPVAACMIAMFWPGPRRGRMLGLAAAWAMPYLFGLEDQHGILAIVAAVGASLWLVDRAARGGTWSPLARWTGGLLLAGGGYLCMAWTMGLAVATIDFGFTIPWLPGRLHERLWWLVFALTTMKSLLPVLLLMPMARGLLGDRVVAVQATSGAVVLLRLSAIAAFAVGWLVVAGPDAGGLRLAAILQDAFFWALIGLALGGGRQSPSEEMVAADVVAAEKASSTPVQEAT